MRWDGVVGVCWFLVAMCSVFGVGAVRETAVLRFFGEDRWPSASGQFGLARREVRFFICYKYGMCSTVFPCRLWFWIWYLRFFIL